MKPEVQKALEYIHHLQDEKMHLDDEWFQMKILLRAVEDMEQEIEQLQDDLCYHYSK